MPRTCRYYRLTWAASVRMLCGLYMDPPEMSRHSRVVEEQRQMHTYIRLLHESLPGFRALMTSARAHLIDLSASQALGHSRLWARRSDRFAHHSHPLASYGRIPVVPHLATVCRVIGGLVGAQHSQRASSKGETSVCRARQRMLQSSIPVT
jgi:hypothetical protein